MRIVYYALGGGLGHLVRARAFLHTLGLSRDAVVITASDAAHDRRVVGNLEIVFAPKSLEQDAAVFRAWLLRELDRFRPDCLCVDAFPAGILGELCDLPPLACELWHVARLLRWDVYSALIAGTAPHFRRVFRVEPLLPAHRAWLDAHAVDSEDFELIDPPCEENVGAPDEAYWLVVHSGPTNEVAELIAYADEIRSAESADVALWIASAAAPGKLPARTRVLDVHPAVPYFREAQRLFSAAGFNVMRQARDYRHKHMIMPMPRRFDAQFERVKAR